MNKYDNEGYIRNLHIFLRKFKVNQNFSFSNKYQVLGDVKCFNRSVQRLLQMEKYHHKDKFNLEY